MEAGSVWSISFALLVPKLLLCYWIFDLTFGQFQSVFFPSLLFSRRSERTFSKCNNHHPFCRNSSKPTKLTFFDISWMPFFYQKSCQWLILAHLRAPQTQLSVLAPFRFKGQASMFIFSVTHKKGSSFEGGEKNRAPIKVFMIQLLLQRGSCHWNAESRLTCSSSSAPHYDFQSEQLTIINWDKPSIRCRHSSGVPTSRECAATAQHMVFPPRRSQGPESVWPRSGHSMAVTAAICRVLFLLINSPVLCTQSARPLAHFNKT